MNNLVISTEVISLLRDYAICNKYYVVITLEKTENN
jgi:hypothetical protein